MKDDDKKIVATLVRPPEKRPVSADRIKQIRTELGMSVKQFAAALGVRESTISNYEAGFRRPRQKTMNILTDLGNCTVDWIDGKSDVRNPTDFQGVYDAGFEAGKNANAVKSLEVPVYNPLSCGTGSFVDEQPEDYIGVPLSLVSHGKFFANQAEGDSMEPRIHNGDYLIFEQVDDVPSGKIGSFSLNDEYYCKVFRQYKDGSRWLISLNEEYPPIPVHDTDQFRILGLYKYKLSKEQ